MKDEGNFLSLPGVLGDMTRSASSDWTKLAVDSWQLAWEASTVIGLRMARFSVPDAGNMAEAQRMIAEKMEAVAQLQMRAVTGGLGVTPQGAARKAVAHYRKAVGRNRRRLTKPAK